MKLIVLHGRKKSIWGRENDDRVFGIGWDIYLNLCYTVVHLIYLAFNIKNVGFVKVMGHQSVPIHGGIYFPLSFFPLIYCCTAQNVKTAGYLLNNNTGTLSGLHYAPILPCTAVTKSIQTRGHIFNVTTLYTTPQWILTAAKTKAIFNLINIFHLWSIGRIKGFSTRSALSLSYLLIRRV